MILKGLKFNNFLAKNCKPSIYRALEKRVESQVINGFDNNFTTPISLSLSISSNFTITKIIINADKINFAILTLFLIKGNAKNDVSVVFAGGGICWHLCGAVWRRWWIDYRTRADGDF